MNESELNSPQDTLSFGESCGQTVQEIHIDFLLEEEFNANPAFLRRFIVAAGKNDDPV
jgi:hypothetical protein